MHDPWKNLTINNILNSVEEVIGQKLSGLCLQRNSYINRVYELELIKNKQRIIVKFYRPERWDSDMIFTEHSFLEKLYTQEIPVITPLEFDATTLFQFDNIFFSIFEKKGGRALDEFDEETWKQLGRLIGRTHSISSSLKITNRIKWTPSEITPKHIQAILNSNCILPDFIDSFKNISSLFLQKASPLFNDIPLIPIHGDCHKGNFIIRPNEGIYLTDFDDMSIGPAIQDVWMLLSNIDNKTSKELMWFIGEYELFKDFPDNQFKLIPYLRGMRIIHYVAWIAMQSGDDNFQNLFPQFQTHAYWNETIRELQSIVYS